MCLTFGVVGANRIAGSTCADAAQRTQVKVLLPTHFYRHIFTDTLTHTHAAGYALIPFIATTTDCRTKQDGNYTLF